jgi:hypothetical protein
VARTTEGLPYLVMELLDGTDLSERLAKGDPVATRDAVGWMIQVAAAMVVAHEAGVVHRDLKPSNVFLMRRTGKIKVLDFGVATFRVGAADETSTKSVAGTPRYMAPEQLLGRAPDPRSDLWAIGVMLYRLLGGRHPFEATTTAGQMLAIQEGPTPLAELAPDLPTDLVAAVERALAVAPELRWQSARALLEALTPFGSVEVRASAFPPPETRDAVPTVAAPEGAGEVADTRQERLPDAEARPQSEDDASVDVAVSSSRRRADATERSATSAIGARPRAPVERSELAHRVRGGGARARRGRRRVEAERSHAAAVEARPELAAARRNGRGARDARRGACPDRSRRTGRLRARAQRRSRRSVGERARRVESALGTRRVCCRVGGKGAARRRARAERRVSDSPLSVDAPRVVRSLAA